MNPSSPPSKLSATMASSMKEQEEILQLWRTPLRLFEQTSPFNKNITTRIIIKNTNSEIESPWQEGYKVAYLNYLVD